MPGELEAGPCHDKDNTFHIHSMYELAVEISKRRFHDLQFNGAAALWKWSDFALGRYYINWMRCVANNPATGVNLKWIEDHGGDEYPSQDAFVKAVRQEPDISAMNVLKGW